jgi:hypothetical protein
MLWRILPLLLTCLLLTACGSDVVDEVRILTPNAPQIDVAPAPVSSGTIHYENISFTLNEALNTVVVPETVEAAALENPTDKPDNVHPRHTLFKFEGKYGEASQGNFFQPETRVYPIEEYKQQYAVSPDSLAYFTKDLDALRKLLAVKSRPSGKQVPFVPYLDAGMLTDTHVKYVDFKSGSGVLFLTHFDIETAPVTNQALTYVFEGISTDGKYLVVAAFPVSVPFLPGLKEEKCVDCEYPYAENDLGYPKSKKEYKRYMDRVTKRLESTEDQNFVPNLKLLQQLVVTINLNDQ